MFFEQFLLSRRFCPQLARQNLDGLIELYQFCLEKLLKLWIVKTLLGFAKESAWAYEACDVTFESLPIVEYLLELVLFAPLHLSELLGLLYMEIQLLLSYSFKPFLD